MPRFLPATTGAASSSASVGESPKDQQKACGYFSCQYNFRLLISASSTIGQRHLFRRFNHHGAKFGDAIVSNA
ncbi:hypothetical protein ATS45_04540 [Salmonella enterica]|nr:hypothetical protein [Salmonella enterica]EAR8730429.1 hypothetical protein [Salmonella enterica]EAY2125121.1 hypothetical protein [Salmonella enterica]EAY2196001.1 hypothetical protein [Salmonella enterica]EAY2210349.1 hypothetical protein [Salmonella enterica]